MCFVGDGVLENQLNISIVTYSISTTGESCTDPVITPSAYTTSDAVISSESVFIVELSLACTNGAQVSLQHLRQNHHKTDDALYQ